MILRRLRAEGVDVAGMTVEAGAPTGLLIREVRPLVSSNVLYRRQGSAGSRLTQDDLVRAGGLRGARWLHITGITPALSPTAARIDGAIDAARNRPARRSRSTSTFVVASGPRNAAPVLRASVPFRRCPGRSRRTGAGGRWRFLGSAADRCRRIAGGHQAPALGARSLDADGESADVPRSPLTGAVDPIGAGDAFCAGFIAARLEGSDIETGLRWGNACAAACIAVKGDVEAFPSRPELLGMLAGGPDTCTLEGRA